MAIGIVPNLTDPTQTLQLQFYTVNAKVVSNVSSIQGIQQQIADLTTAIANLTTQKNTLQTQLNNITAYLTSIGVTDLTQPLTQAQINTITAAGYATTVV